MRVLIVGAGGHAQVVADILQQQPSLQAIGYLDDNSVLHGQTLLGLPVLGSMAQSTSFLHEAVIIAIGDNRLRRQLYEQWSAHGEQFVTLQHPSAVLARDVTIGSGTLIAAGVIVNPGSVIGANVILNTGCTIDHHTRIGAHVHVAPGVHTGGEVTIEEGVLIGIGATIMPRCSLGAWSRVGAGAVVHADVPAGETVVGVPARALVRTGKEG